MKTYFSLQCAFGSYDWSEIQEYDNLDEAQAEMKIEAATQTRRTKERPDKYPKMSFRILKTEQVDFCESN